MRSFQLAIKWKKVRKLHDDTGGKHGEPHSTESLGKCSLRQWEIRRDLSDEKGPAVLRSERIILDR